MSRPTADLVESTAGAGADEISSPVQDGTPDSPGRIRLALRQRGLRTRIGLLAAVAVGLSVALASLAAYLTVRHELRQHLDDNLRQRASAAVASGLPQLLSQPIDSQFASELLALGADLRPAVIDIEPDGGQRVLFLSDKPPPYSAAEIAVATGDGAPSLRTASTAGIQFRVLAVRVQPGQAFVLAQATTDTDDELRRMALVMLIVGAAGIVVATSAGLGVARQALRPVERLTAATEHIARTDDLTPIHVVGRDELARLTASFNVMLEALAQSRDRQRQLVADAGHELRTPLTSMRTNLDLLVQSSRPGAPPLDPADRDELLADVRAQIEELTVLVGDLVELARIEPAYAVAEPVDLAAVVERAVERVRRRAPNVRIDVDARPWTVVGETATLERAATNLLDNAAKWSPDGGVVTVRLGEGVLSVADQGPGISDADQPHVFERFYRAVDARGLPGSGLGLAIVKQAVERHGGTVTAGRTTSGGALLVVRLPGAGPAADRGATFSRASDGSQRSVPE